MEATYVCIKQMNGSGSWDKCILLNHYLAFDCVDHNKLWDFLKEMGIPEHLTCLL